MATAPRVKVKICGMTRLDDALQAVECGADAVGFIFFRKSPRWAPEKTALSIVRELPPLVARVGVFVNESAERINRLVDRLHLDLVQLHGEETPAFCRKIRARLLKAVRVRDAASLTGLDRYPVDGFLLDAFHAGAYGGTGQVFDWKLSRKAKAAGPIILAGGLTADNVAAAIVKVRPYGVDVCSGVEKVPGRKDYKKLRDFFKAVREAD
ncbi:MAG: phosphoribosylanthranilate isomerase [Nitrospinaceae bacterium]